MAEQPEQRIAVIGSPGAGKSTLATLIAEATGLPLIHLDREYWRPGWVEPDADEWQAANARLIAGEAWVIDGNYGSSLAARAKRATVIVWFDLPTRVCLLGVVRRALRYRGAVRPDMREGCPERLDGEFVRFLHYIVMFRRRKRPALAAELVRSAKPVVRIGSTAERARFAQVVAAEGAQGIVRLASATGK
jgi:adenylate kinase family enzyme